MRADRFPYWSRGRWTAPLGVARVRDANAPIKLLGDGALTKRFVVEVTKVSRQAAEKIKAAGGDVKVV